ncbi:MAG: primase-helicase family protein [Bacteroidota bacterium]
MDYNSDNKDNKTIQRQYLDQRLKELNITPQSNKITLQNHGESQNEVFFEADSYGNILINYYNIHGNRAQFRKNGNKWEERFVRTRIKEPKPNAKGEINKYLSPRGSGLRPFFPPQIIQKVKSKEIIETLFITEGEFKAFKGALHNIDVIGIPSIHGFYDIEKHKNQRIKVLHFEIEQLIEICRVKNLVYLTDADTLTVNYEFRKEMTNRPMAFYSAVKNIRQSLNPLLKRGILQKVYFSHIHSNFMDSAKGLDDLLVKFNLSHKEIVEDLYKLSKSKKFFTTQDLSGADYNWQLVKYFGLNSVKTFHKVYADHIENNKFKYKNAIYYFDNEKVVFFQHKDTEQFLRVGGNWYKIIYITNKFGELERDIIPFPKTEITGDYEGFPGFLRGIKKYDAFTVYPNWTGEHQSQINDSFNLYSEMAYKPKQGSWENTYKFLKHIFQGYASIDLATGKEHNIKGDTFSVFLDYLTLIYVNPTQMLPVPVLVSKKQGTGKTTLLKYLAEIYKGNSTVLNNAQFQTKFNRHYITKYLIGVDEAIMGADQVEAKKDKERLKQLVTGEEAQLEDKGVNLKKIPFYGKILMTSNDEDTLMKIDEEDTRFFIIKVPRIAKEDKNPDLFKELKKEIPALLYYLEQREIFHKKKDRFWFETEDYLTEHFYKLKDATKSPLEKAIEDTVREMFFTFLLPAVNMHPAFLLELINKNRGRKFQITQLKDKLKNVYKLKHQKQRRISIPIKWVQDGMTKKEEIYYEKFRLSYHVYDAVDWLTESEIEDHKIPAKKELPIN